jgi:hypothetical protein
MHLHQRVGLLLLLEDGGCGLVVLWRVSTGILSDASGDAYILLLSAGGVSVSLLVAVSCSEAGGDITYFDRSGFGLVCSGSADMLLMCLSVVLRELLLWCRERL